MYRSPSVKKLMEDLKLSKDAAIELKNIMKGASAENAMICANRLLKGHGVESIRVSDWISHYYQDIGLLYVNLGDTYDATLCYETEKENFIICSWGSWVESKKDGYVL